MKIAYKSDIGRVRDRDEDSIVILKTSTVYDSREYSKLLLVLGDGMGGSPCGEIASCLGTKILAEYLTVELLSPMEGIDYLKSLEYGIKQVKNEILEYAIRNPECAGMGTTIVAAILENEMLYAGNVGDSKLYIINEKEIRQITEDHRSGGGSITRAIGRFQDVEVDLFKSKLCRDDILLVCCDGLTDMVGEKEIHDTVLGSENLDDACNNLIKMANENGGIDNISVILVKNEDEHA